MKRCLDFVLACLGLLLVLLPLQRHLGALPKFAHAKPRVYGHRRPEYVVF